MQDLKLLDAGPEGTVLFEIKIDEKYSNLNGREQSTQLAQFCSYMQDVMHGGAAGVIFDMGTATALGPLARPGFYLYGVEKLDPNCF
jgi:acyl-coenzyme A thioesterase 13